MKISKDLYIVYGNEYVLIYNFFLNRACFMRKKIYIDYFLNKTVFKNVNNLLSKIELDRLIDNGVVISDESLYETRSYEKKLENRNTEVKIKQVYLHLTQRCNLRCSYCYNKQNLTSLNDPLNTQQIFNIIDALAKVSVKEIILTGGEPLIRNDTPEIIDYIYSKKISCQLLTNGLYLDRIYNKFNELDHIVVSLDTLSQSQNLRKGLSINQLIQTLCKIPLIYRKKVILRSVVTNKSSDSWREVERFASSEGFGFVTAIMLPNNENDIHYMPNINDIKIDGSVLNFGGNICGGAYREIAIDSNGDIYPCQSLITKELKITNIIDCNNWYIKLGESKITEQFRKATVNNISECNDCKFRYLCGGGCRAIPYKLSGSIFNKSNALCQYHKRFVQVKLSDLLNRFEEGTHEKQ